MIADPGQSPQERTIVWFRKDLRIQDNPSLFAALENNQRIIPVFIWDEEAGGSWKLGASSRWWLHHALLDLSQSIRNLGGQLLLLKGNAEEVIPHLANKYGAKQVYYGRTYDPSGIETQVLAHKKPLL